MGVVIVFRDYTEKWLRLKKIEHLIYHDDLTDLYNRRFFDDALRKIDIDDNLPITIIMGDVNGLKLINDSFGHLVGDEVLIKTANALSNDCDANEIISRLGGDEFTILIPKCDDEHANRVISRIKGNLVGVSVQNLGISVSFGFGIKYRSEQNLREVLRESEDFMYKHKLYESSSMRSKTIDLILKSLFEKNPREAKHSKRVSSICMRIAEKLGLSSENVNSIKLAGLMHDIGKIGIEEAILNKNGLLDSLEYEQIKKHPDIGCRILSSVLEFNELALAVLQHHERWDGSGYPQKLKREEISLTARIISVADSYDAMTTFRTYTQSRSKDEAIVELNDCSGSQFDPMIVKVLVEILKENPNI